MKLNPESYLWVIISSIMIAPAGAQMPTPPAVPDEVHNAAMNSLRTFQELAPNLGVGGPGGKTNNDSKPNLGLPVPDYAIDADALKKWDGGDPEKLFRATGQFVYSINSEGTPESAVTIAKTKDGWSAITFASPEEAAARSRAIKEGDAPGGNAPTVQVRVPVLHATFIAQKIDGNLVFTPLESQPALGLKAGTAELATKVLHRIQPAAKSLNLNHPG